MTRLSAETASAGDEFWQENQPGFRFTSHPAGSPAFFAAVEEHRYEAEPHILEMLRPERWAGHDVLEAGCGVGTDGIQLARAGARYTGLDGSPNAVELARRRFELEGRDGAFVHGSVTDLPFPDDSFDLVYSHGVIHHIPDTQRAVAEFHRVLRPRGTALVMLYHRNSLNYWFTIMAVRRALAALLLLPRAAGVVAPATGERADVLEGHRALLREHGLRYLTDSHLFLSDNTDGPGNPLSKVYSAEEARELFRAFDTVDTDVRFLNLRIYPGGNHLATTAAAKKLERRLGWHLYVTATKR